MFLSKTVYLNTFAQSGNLLIATETCTKICIVLDEKTRIREKLYLARH